MKYIKKGDEPKSLIEWKNLANEDWQPTYEELSGSLKKEVKASLIKEQGGICCYCERELTEQDSHIEHFKPQSDESVDLLDYSNMICSCQNRLKKGEPRHCGNLKGDWFDEKLLISPMNSDCSKFFEFTFDGQISATNANKAGVETIEKLGLDLDKLNKLRSQAIEPFIDPTLTEEELSAFVSGYLKEEDGKFEPFFTTIEFLFKDIK